jgi:hypothetical protein
LRTAAWAAFAGPDDVVVVLAELEVPGWVEDPEEHPAMVAIAATAAIPASVFLKVVMARLTVGVTFASSHHPARSVSVESCAGRPASGSFLRTG